MTIPKLPKTLVIIESRKMEKLFEAFLSIYHEYLDIVEIKVGDPILTEFNELYAATVEFLDETNHSFETEEDIYESCPEFIDYNLFRVFVELYPVEDFHVTGVNNTSPILYDRFGTVHLTGDLK